MVGCSTDVAHLPAASGGAMLIDTDAHKLPAPRIMSRLTLSFALLTAAVPVGAQTALVVGRPVSATLARGDTARYALDADSGMVLRVRVDQTSVNAALRLRGPKGDVLRTVNAAPRGTEQVQLETTQTGVHEVQVLPADSGAGAYTITLVSREALSANPARLVDQLMAPWDRRDGPGAAVAVWRGGRTVFSKAYGMANLAYDIPFTVTTPTNIGSTSKQFTAFAVMLLVEDGKVSLDDDVRKHIPELPDLGKKVSVRNLLTHTTGYREVYNAFVLAGRRIDEGDYIARDEMISVVRNQPGLQNEPGAEFNYNNTSFALLALLVENVSKQPFADFMAQRVFASIGMTSTMVRSDRHGIVRGATVGYSRAADGTWRDLGDLASSMGAGGIYTTLGDLQKWAENLLSPRVGTAGSVAQMMTPFTLSTGKSTGYGFGLTIDKQGTAKRVHHGGADISHRSMLVLYPELNAGVTVQSNDGGFSSSAAFRIAAAFFTELAPPRAAGTNVAQKFDPASYDAKKFDAYAGRYAIDVAPNVILTFRRSGDSLSIQVTGQPAAPIYPTSDSTFVLRVVEAAVSFHRNAQGQVSSVTLHQGGDNRATRLPDSAPAVAGWKPTATELTRYAGRYFSAEFESFYEVRASGDTLMVEGRRTGKATLRSGAKDTFTATGPLEGVSIVFERDRSGQVVAFYSGNGRTRDVRFVRMQ